MRTWTVLSNLQANIMIPAVDDKPALRKEQQWKAMIPNNQGRIIVGALGHRSIEHPDIIARAVDKVLDTLKDVFSCTRITVLSSLAEGADRLIAQRCLVLPDTNLIVSLPMPVKEYSQDFLTPASNQEFQALLDKADEVVILSTSRDRLVAYQTAGEYLVLSSTVLLAIWDGLPARGIGGTAETVKLARKRNLPLAWIYSPQPNDFETARNAGARKVGDITLERLPGLSDRHPEKE